MYAEHLYAEGLYAHGVAAVTVAYRTVEYHLELRSKTGTLLAHLPWWDKAVWTQETNVPDRLEFTYPAWDEVCADLETPNQVWLRDSAHEYELLQKFRIQVVKQVSEKNEYVAVTCEDLLCQLADEWIDEYEGGPTDTVADALSDWFGRQVNSPKLSRYLVSSGIANEQMEISVVNQSVLAAIRNLQEKLGGYMRVSPARRFTWTTSIGKNIGQQIRRGKNLKGIEVERDFTEMTNRLYAYGAGQNRDSRLTLKDAGESHEYLDDSSSQSTWGRIVCGVYHNSEITDASTLKKVAQKILAAESDPRIDYLVDIPDLSQDANAPRDFEHIELGARIVLIDEKLGISTTQHVVKVERDLRKKLNITVGLSNKKQLLGHLIAELIQKQKELDLGDVETSELDPEDIGTAADPGSTGEFADAGHRHKGLTVYTSNPEPLGTASPGDSGFASDGKHVHPIPKYT